MYGPRGVEKTIFVQGWSFYRVSVITEFWPIQSVFEASTHWICKLCEFCVLYARIHKHNSWLITLFQVFQPQECFGSSVLRQYAECISRHAKWTSGAQVLNLYFYGSIARSLARSFGRSIARSLGRLLARALARSLARSFGRLVARSLSRSVAWLIARWLSRSLTWSLVTTYNLHASTCLSRYYVPLKTPCAST